MPFVAVGLILVTWLGLYRFFRVRIDSWSEAFMLASLVLGVWFWLVSELQSLTGTLTSVGALIWWLLAATLSLPLAFAVRNRSNPTREALSSSWLSQLRVRQRPLVLGISLIVGITGLVAWISPITAWDALAYHLPRVFYWVQYGSIEHFPTPNDRLLFMGPWSAFVQMQLFLLAGSDKLAHMLQWLSMVGCVFAATTVARALGAKPPSQILAGTLVVSIPMGIAQATTALTDYTVSFWLIVFAYYSLTPFWKEDHGWLDRFAAGTALGLAILSKGTAIPIALPFLVLYIVGETRSLRSVPWKELLVVGALAFGLNAPHTTRNSAVFNHPLAPEAHRQLVGNQSFGPRYLVSNLVRQTLVHLGTWNKSHSQPLLATSKLIHGALGIEDGDPLNSHMGQKLKIAPLRFNENLAGNGLHVLLFAVCGVWLLSHLHSFQTRTNRVYSIAWLGSMLLFCLFIKYQHSISRLQLPLFVLGTPWAAAVLDRWLAPRKTQIVGWVFILAVLPWVAFSEARPLLGAQSIFRQSREDLFYSIGKPAYVYPSERVALRARNENQQIVGFVNSGESLEYYLWYELRKHNASMPRIENIMPDDGGTPALAVPSRLTTPPGLIAWFKAPKPPPTMTFLGLEYERLANWRWGPFAVYKTARTTPENRRRTKKSAGS